MISFCSFVQGSILSQLYRYPNPFFFLNNTRRMTSRSSPLDESVEEQVFTHPSNQQQPDLNIGLAYWNSVAQKDLTNNGVLGGFGNGSLPRIDAMGSRLFLLTIRPELSKIDPPYETNRNQTNVSNRATDESRLYRSLDVGAGIGRVTSDVLLYLFDRIDLLEPVTGFIETAQRNALNGKWAQLHKPNHHSKKGVRFWKKPIQSFDPLQAIANQSSHSAPIQISNEGSIVGAQDGWNDGHGYDVIWAQWTLGHLSDEELVDFLKKCKKALRPPSRKSSDESDEKSVESNHQIEIDSNQMRSFDRDGGLIIVKENIYVSQSDPDIDCFLFDKEDSSLTRSHQSFLRIFKQAGLELVQQDVQKGFDPELYKVNFYALQ